MATTSLDGVKCSRCSTPALRRQGNQALCPKHYRFGQMRIAAKRAGKVVPSHDALEAMVRAGNRCVDCDEVMPWLAREDQVRVATLQHYRDGTMALACRSCNVRHSAMPGDTFRSMPKDHKRCPACEVTKPLAEFSRYRNRRGEQSPRSRCRPCANAAWQAWKANRNPKFTHQPAREKS